MKQIITILTALLMFSCVKDKKEGENLSMTMDKGKMYSFLADSSKIKWTAFKFTERVGVSGTFDSLYISGTKTASSISAVFSSASFDIPINSINSANPDRDKKLVQFFFGKMKATDRIQGMVSELGEDGRGKMLVKMNGQEKAVDFKLQISGMTAQLDAVIDLETFMAQEAVSSLNAVCKDLHKGKDGLSKLWPDVKLSLQVMLK